MSVTTLPTCVLVLPSDQQVDAANRKLNNSFCCSGEVLGKYDALRVGQNNNVSDDGLC